MKWVNHIIIGASLAVAFNPVMLPVVVAGSTAPDWLERVFRILNYPLAHRAQTHYVFVWIMACVFFFFVADFYSLFFWFSLGALSHVLADSLTVSGVPLGWWSEKRFHVFGGRLRTGDRGEYIVSGSVALLALIVGYGSGHLSQSQFFPFFYQWHNLYQDGIIDGYEWKQNRFKFI